MGEVTADFIARDPWRMVLVEQGPWDDLKANLLRVQERLYGCLDAAVDGQLAKLYPASIGSVVTLQLDCYALPQEPIASLFQEFSSAVLGLSFYAQALASSKFVAGINFAVNFDQLEC